MDLALEANRNSALFNTMQQVLDVYNPLLHKARPTIVNQTKHRIRAQPTRWANTMDIWNGTQTVRFDIPRIGSLVDFTLKCAFRIPGVPPTDEERAALGDRGYAKTTLTLGGDITDNRNELTNDARGRLDRLYADRLLGFNMIKQYVVSSKSRRIFNGTGEYLLTRFSQMDEDMKKSVMDAITPVNVLNPDIDDTFYAPGITYSMTIPLFMFFNEHITSALDVNFSEEVHIDIELRSPDNLFYYGQLGDLSHVPVFAATQFQNYTGTAGEPITWDQGVNASSAALAAADGFVPKDYSLQTQTIAFMQQFAMRHIQGVGAPYDKWSADYGTGMQWTSSGPTFAYPAVDSNGESVQVQFEANCDFIVQDTDAYRALRMQMFPEGAGLTTIVYDTHQEVYQRLMASTDPANNILDTRSGGTFTDPSQSAAGITMGDSSRFIDLPIRNNNLAYATHFMVRKHSDLGGDKNTRAGDASEVIGLVATKQIVGAHRTYTRAIPVSYFQIMAAGRVIYESDADTQLNLTQAGMYNGTGLEWGAKAKTLDDNPGGTTGAASTNGRPFNVYSINYGLQASRLENSGTLSYQNLNNPVLRIYLRPDTWSEFSTDSKIDRATGLPLVPPVASDAVAAAAMGLQVDVIHEFFNVVTINSGNGEITSGLNQ